MHAPCPFATPRHATPRPLPRPPTASNIYLTTEVLAPASRQRVQRRSAQPLPARSKQRAAVRAVFAMLFVSAPKFLIIWATFRVLALRALPAPRPVHASPQRSRTNVSRSRWHEVTSTSTDVGLCSTGGVAAAIAAMASFSQSAGASETTGSSATDRSSLANQCERGRSMQLAAIPNDSSLEQSPISSERSSSNFRVSTMSSRMLWTGPRVDLLSLSRSPSAQGVVYPSRTRAAGRPTLLGRQGQGLRAVTSARPRQAACRARLSAQK